MKEIDDCKRCPFCRILRQQLVGEIIAECIATEHDNEPTIKFVVDDNRRIPLEECLLRKLGGIKIKEG